MPEVDKTIRGKGPHADDKAIVIAAVEVRQRPAKKGDKPVKRGGRYAGRLRMEVIGDRTAQSMVSFVEAAVAPGAMVVTDAARRIERGEFCKFIAADNLRSLATALDLKAKAEDEPDIAF